MKILNVFFGLVTIVSFGIALYQRYEIKKNSVTERSKVIIQMEKINAIYEALRSIGSSVDMIVQVPKHNEVTVQELQNIARSVRSNIYVTMKLIKGQKRQLEQWRYGELVASDPFAGDVVNSEKQDK